MSTGARGIATAPPPGPAVGRPLAATVFLAMALGPLNSSMIAVALVSIQRDLDVTLAAVTLLVSAFYLASTVGQTLMGRLADLLGARRVFCAGLVIVLVIGLVAPLAPSLGWLVVARVLLALGTSAAFPAGLALIRRNSDPSGGAPSGVLGGVMIAAAVSAALGPALGGVLVQAAGWEAIFLVNAPLAAGGLVLALRAVPRDAAVGPLGAMLRTVDWAGIALFATTLTALLVFLLTLQDGPLWWLLGAGGLAAALLWVRERRARTPFIDVNVATDRRLGAVFAQYAGVNVVFYATYFSIPQWLEQARAYTPGEVGVIFLSVAATGLVVTPLAVRVNRRHGPRPVLIAGGTTLVAGTALLLVLDATTPLIGILLVGVVLGIPNGCNNIGLQALLYDRAPDGHTGAAAGFFQTSRYAAAILATAVMGAVLGERATTAGMHDLALLATPIAVLLLIAGVRSERRPPQDAPGSPAGRPAPPPSRPSPDDPGGTRTRV